LLAGSFDPARPAFFSWLGVTVYLTTEAIDAVLGFVGSLPKSSEIVFTFTPPDSSLEPDEARHLAFAAARAAARGEPWRTRSEPDLLVETLHRLGFTAVSFLSPGEVDRRYMRGRRDGLRTPRGGRIATATV
jgi:O-methyltransferase involved in polyketide biosynthesis